MRFSHRPALYLPAILLLGAVFNLARTELLAQGSLTPPGSPAPTMKTLDQIRSTGIAINNVNTPGNSAYTYVISAPGSYYLTGNLTGTGALGGIVIQSGGVTIDLNGFFIDTDGGSGITDGGNFLRDICIKNGNFDACAGAGLDLSHCLNTVFSELVVVQSRGVGIAGGEACMMRDCISRDNSGDNITTGLSATLKDCVAVGSTNGNGISIGLNGVVTGCTCDSNKLDGIYASGASNSVGTCSISHCAAASNSGNGFNAGRNCIFAHCTATKNTLAGFILGPGTEITASTASANTGHGIDGIDRVSVVECTASFNTSSGIHANYGSTVKKCYCADNAVCGILTDAGGAFDIKENTCVENGTGGTTHGAGIRVIGGSGSVSNNWCGFNYQGIDIQNIGNIITGNRAKSNTQNYNFIAGNAYGPVINSFNSGSAAVTGNSALSTLGSTDPNANFVY